MKMTCTHDARQGVQRKHFTTVTNNSRNVLACTPPDLAWFLWTSIWRCGIRARHGHRTHSLFTYTSIRHFLFPFTSYFELCRFCSLHRCSIRWHLSLLNIPISNKVTTFIWTAKQGNPSLKRRINNWVQFKQRSWWISPLPPLGRAREGRATTSTGCVQSCADLAVTAEVSRDPHLLWLFIGSGWLCCSFHIHANYASNPRSHFLM